MKITFDRKTNTAYIYFSSVEPNEPLRTYPCDPIEIGGQINLDFDSKGTLFGIEVLDATQLLPEELLMKAELIE
jgi:uncharacterized protein YuzE